jgi:hypothetical protein
MKRLFTLFILIIAGCSSPSSNSSNPPPPGWVDNIQLGKFAGIWKLGTVTDSCTTNVTETDSILRALVSNRRTGEVLSLTGGLPGSTVTFGVRLISYVHAFNVDDSSNFYGDTDSVPNGTDANCIFSNNTDTLFYSTKRGTDSLFVTCIRTVQ